MKEFVCALAATAVAAFSTPALADFDFDVMGQVTAVSPQSITVDSMGRSITVSLFPYVEVEVERRGYDYHTSVHDIRVGEWVKMEVIPMGQGQYMAKEIEIYRR